MSKAQSDPGRPLGSVNPQTGPSRSFCRIWEWNTCVETILFRVLYIFLQLGRRHSTIFAMAEGHVPIVGSWGRLFSYILNIWTYTLVFG